MMKAITKTHKSILFSLRNSLHNLYALTLVYTHKLLPDTDHTTIQAAIIKQQDQLISQILHYFNYLKRFPTQISRERLHNFWKTLSNLKVVPKEPAETLYKQLLEVLSIEKKNVS